MDNQDWNTVTFSKKKQKKKTTGGGGNNNNGVVKKYNAGTNRSSNNNSNIDDDLDHFEVEKVELSMGRKIQQARQAKGWTQKDLGMRINEKAQVVNSYENGRAIPSNQVISKMERALGTRLRAPKKKKRNNNN
eukprot:TRINITY_DN14849_c0_g1_i1.p1 TRINITY_DN14849_c0_g1~~TRINITY_DN14849_c0_g1_i1.p1  ORF type:complete len:133 (-),score=39.06 TRINITY_DN14849_c0_g1_i1:83-481(-)